MSRLVEREGKSGARLPIEVRRNYRETSASVPSTYGRFEHGDCLSAMKETRKGIEKKNGSLRLIMSSLFRTNAIDSSCSIH